MSKINLLNLVLFVAAISLAFFIYFSEEQSFELERVTGIDPDTITGIKIKHNNSTTAIIKQGDNSWQITRPVTIAANDFRINAILKLINAPAHNTYKLSEINTRTLGLENPDTSIQFDGKSARYEVSFGITNPATNLRYIRLNDSVYTIEDVYYPLISSHFGTLASLNLLPDNASIEKLVLGNQTISKNGKGLWQSNSEIASDDIIKVIDNWQHTQAFGIHEYLEREYLGEIFIYLKGQQIPITYLITDTEPWLILARPELGLEYHLDIEAYDKLIVPQ